MTALLQRIAKNIQTNVALCKKVIAWRIWIAFVSIKIELSLGLSLPGITYCSNKT